jgi:adenylate cyclase
MLPAPKPEQERDGVANALSVLRGSNALASEPRAARALEIIASALGLADAHDPARAQAAGLLDASLDLDAILQSALSLAVDVTQADHGYIVPRGAGRLVTAGRRARVTNSIPAGDESATRARTVACVPLDVRGETIGALYLDATSENALRSGDRTMLTVFATQAALALDCAKMFGVERGRADHVSALQAFQIRILEAIASGVITIASDRSISSFNRSAETTFGVLANDMLGKTAGDIAAFIPDLPELLDIYFDSGTIKLRAEVEARSTDSTARTLEIALAPLETAEGLGIAIVVTDVTKYRRLELAHEAQITKAGRIAETFSRYLAPHVVDRLMNDPVSVKLGGERQRGTMMFADIAGFTSLAARLPAERVVEILNLYFEEAVRIIFEHDGLLDKFYGDGLMAVFGPPRAREGDAGRAVRAAIALHEAVERLAPLLDQPLKISVGLATGEVVAGPVGSTKRMDYTVIGDAVNLASGLQHAAPPGTIYCDEETIERAGIAQLRAERRTISIKGRSGFVSAYAIESPRDAVALANVTPASEPKTPRSLAGPP